METVEIILDREDIQYFSDAEKAIFDDGRFFLNTCGASNNFVFLLDEPKNVICPCSSTDCNGMWLDYVSHPMIWCDECGRRSFICIDCKPQVSENEECISYTYPLMITDAVINSQIYDWTWKDNTFKHFESFAKIRDDSIASYELNLKDKNNSTILQILPQHDYGFIGRETQKKIETMFANNIGLNKNIYQNTDYSKEVSWKYSVKCNSTNVLDVKIPLDMSHDGIDIFCKCHCDQCKTVVYTNYNGD